MYLPNIAFKNYLDLESSGGVLCTRQAYDRIHTMIVQLSNHPRK
jgi:hypothetical protein